MSRTLKVASALFLFAASQASAQDLSQLAGIETVITPGYERVTGFIWGRGAVWGRGQ